jgi:hypothetical protein
LKPHDGCKKLPALSLPWFCKRSNADCQSQSPCGNAKTVLSNFFVLSIFEQFDYELETRPLKSENRFHAQHLLPHAVDKLTDDHIATIYKAYQADIYLS